MCAVAFTDTAKVTVPVSDAATVTATVSDTVTVSATDTVSDWVPTLGSDSCGIRMVTSMGKQVLGPVGGRADLAGYTVSAGPGTGSSLESR